ncbi:MAG: hypothetical protein ACLR7U_06800 [Ruthenibacterium lactatiformans]
MKDGWKHGISCRGSTALPTSYTLDALRRAMAAGDILESRALSFDSESVCISGWARSKP